MSIMTMNKNAIANYSCRIVIALLRRFNFFESVMRIMFITVVELSLHF